MGLTLAAFGAVTPSATAQAAAPGPDPLGVSQSAAASTGSVLGTPSAKADSTPRATSRALVVNVVTCNESDLQAAIGAVAGVGGTVNLRPGCTYTLTDATPPNDDNGLPVITNNVTVNGSGDTITRAATAADFRFFEVDGPNGNLTLNALTLSNGHASSGLGNGRGGAVWLSGAGPALTLNATTLTSNTADTFGGASDNDNGAGNHATSLLGGGIAAAFGTKVTLNSTPVTGNDVTGSTPQGGGIAQAGTMTLNGSAVTGNAATGTNAQGGGIFDTVVLTSSPVTNNQATGSGADGGGIYRASGTVTLVGSPVTNNQPNNCGSPSTVPGCS